MTTYKLNRAAFRENLLNADWMVGLMRSHAEAGLAAAVAAAHVDTGEFKASFSVTARKHGGVSGDRAEAVVSTDDPDALSIEYGHTTKSGTHVEGEYTLTRALGAM